MIIWLFGLVGRHENMNSFSCLMAYDVAGLTLLDDFGAFSWKDSFAYLIVHDIVSLVLLDDFGTLACKVRIGDCLPNTLIV